MNGSLRYLIAIPFIGLVWCLFLIEGTRIVTKIQLSYWHAYRVWLLVNGLSIGFVATPLYATVEYMFFGPTLFYIFPPLLTFLLTGFLYGVFLKDDKGKSIGNFPGFLVAIVTAGLPLLYGGAMALLSFVGIKAWQFFH